MGLDVICKRQVLAPPEAFHPWSRASASCSLNPRLSTPRVINSYSYLLVLHRPLISVLFGRAFDQMLEIT